jgi:hypothetical protein
MRAFYRAWPEGKILQKLPGESTSHNTNPDSQKFWLSPLASRCLGPRTCGCFLSRMRKPRHPTKSKRCVRVGPSNGPQLFLPAIISPAPTRTRTMLTTGGTMLS